MPANQAALKLTDTDALTAPRSPRRSSPAALRFQQLAADWAALDGVQKSTWNQIAQNTANALQPQAAPARDTAYTAFISANTALLNSGRPALSAAPAVHAVPPALPALALSASYSPATGLSLTLHAVQSQPYVAAPTLVYAARPQLTGRGLYPTTPFTLLGVLPTIENEDLAALYLSKYRVPSAGYQVALKLSPVSATGYRRPPVIVTCEVPPAPSAPLKLK